MMDVQAEQIDEGKDGFIYGATPKPLPRPNRRLDAKTELFDYERWNSDWARNAADPASFAPEYESYIRQIEPTHGHDPGLIYARDFAQKVEKRRGKGGEFVQSLLARLSDRPDLQREFLGGAIPHHPPQGSFRPGGEADVKNWIDQDRIANGIAPKYSKAAQEAAPVLRTSSGVAPAPQATEPNPKNLLEYVNNFGLPEDWALQQQQAQRQMLPEDGLPPDYQSPHKPTPSEHESVDIDGEGNSRRQPRPGEIRDAESREDSIKNKCAQLGLQLSDANNAFYEARGRRIELDSRKADLAAEIEAMKRDHGPPPVLAPRPDHFGPHDNRPAPQQPPPTNPQQTPSTGRRRVRSGAGRPERTAPPTNTPSGPTPDYRRPNDNANSNQFRDAAVFAAERKRWEDTEAAIRGREAELENLIGQSERAAELERQTESAAQRIAERSDRLGCRRFSDGTSGSGHRSSGEPR